MEKNDLVKIEGTIYRILKIEDNKVFAIDCTAKKMPKYYDRAFFNNVVNLDYIPFIVTELEELTPAERKTAQERFTMIASSLSVVDNEKKRSLMIEQASEMYGVSKQTLRSYLCTYLINYNIASLAPKKRLKKELTTHQRNMRQALNKFFYTRNQNSLPTAYMMMLKEKYCDESGALQSDIPSFNQFRYFYRKTRKLENYYISRDGIKDYQRNKRPLLGDGIQEFAPCIGTAMLDSTTCDIYLVDDAGRLIGRPILVAACDANTSLCLGYSLLLEGGTYSLQNLMLNIIEDKVALCERMGIKIKPEQWNVKELPRIMITDGGSEYKGQTFSQIAELGVTVVNLPPYRPDLKGVVEKFFDLIQNSFKDVLKGKGVIMPDFQERGAHDYRKDAVLTMQEFERIIVRCIVYYNCERVLKNYPYTQEMIDLKTTPYANEIWNYKKNTEANNLIEVSQEDLILTLLPRTSAKFTRFGLKVNKLKYYADGYKEKYLSGGDAVAAYNPDNCGKVWLLEKDGSFVEFALIEKRFCDMSFEQVKEIKASQKCIESDALRANYKAKIELLEFVEETTVNTDKKAKIKGIREARSNIKRKFHRNIGGELDG